MLRGKAQVCWFFLLARLCHIERGSSGLCDGLIWPNDGCASIGWLQCRRSTFFPWAFHPARQAARGTPVRPFLAQDKKVARLASSAALRSEDGCSAARLRPVDRHRDRDGRGSETESKENYHGEHRHLHQERGLALSSEKSSPSASRPGTSASSPETNRANENAPSHRAFVGRAEIGAAWPKRSAEQRDYLSVKLDDPSFKRSDLRQPLQRRRGRQLYPDLVASAEGAHDCGRLIGPLPDAPPRGGASRVLTPSRRPAATITRGASVYCAVGSGVKGEVRADFQIGRQVADRAKE